MTDRWTDGQASRQAKIYRKEGNFSEPMASHGTLLMAAISSDYRLFGGNNEVNLWSSCGDQNIRNVMVELCRPVIGIKKREEESFNLGSSKSSTIGSLTICILLWNHWCGCKDSVLLPEPPLTIWDNLLHDDPNHTTSSGMTTISLQILWSLLLISFQMQKRETFHEKQ